MCSTLPSYTPPYVPHPPQVIVVLGIVFGVLVYRAGIAILLVSPLSKVAGSLAGTSVNLIVLVTGAGVQLIFIMIMNEVGVGGGGERGGEERGEEEVIS